jgi:hypothetical protein
MERTSLFYLKEPTKLMEHLLEHRCIPRSKTEIVRQCPPIYLFQPPERGDSMVIITPDPGDKSHGSGDTK